jgi:GTP-binding protein Era
MLDASKSDIVKVGFFAIVGKPNVGKSSLINAVVGQKVSIVSFKPQTTRNKISGIFSDENCQLVFLDTPGFLEPDNKLSEYMVKEIKAATIGVDAVIFVLDCTKGISQREQQSINFYSTIAPLIVVINKIDLSTYDKVYPLIQSISDSKVAKAVIPLSATKLDNIEVLKEACTDLSQPSVRHYDSSQFTDRSLRFMVSEIVREKILLYFEQEIPHGVGVVITQYQDKPKVVVINAEIICNKQSHKQIIIGHNGECIKKIGIKARQDIQTLVDKKVHLDLFVKVREGWKDNNNYLNDIGYI